MRHIAAFIYFVSVSSACYSQGRIYQIGSTNNFAAAVTTERFQFFAASQEENMWCWAACIQMVLNYQGMLIDQCDIVRKAFNSSNCINKPANCYTIETGAGGWVINGQRVSASVDTSPSDFELVDQLAFKNPVVIGLNMPGQNVGHAYVLTAIFFRYNTANEKVPYKVVLRDPWPDNPSRQEFWWDDFISRINCITYINRE